MEKVLSSVRCERCGDFLTEEEDALFMPICESCQEQLAIETAAVYEASALAGTIPGFDAYDLCARCFNPPSACEDCAEYQR